MVLNCKALALRRRALRERIFASGRENTLTRQQLPSAAISRTNVLDVSWNSFTRQTGLWRTGNAYRQDMAKLADFVANVPLTLTDVLRHADDSPKSDLDFRKPMRESALILQLVSLIDVVYSTFVQFIASVIDSQNNQQAILTKTWSDHLAHAAAFGIRSCGIDVADAARNLV